MSIKDFYYKLEEKWYNTLDKIDEKIPIYSVVDKVDAVIPSFLLFLIILFFILFIIVGGLWYSILTYEATFTIKTASGEAVYDTLIQITLVDSGKILKARTNNNGEVKFSGFSKGQEIFLDIDISKGIYKNTFYITQDFKEEIILQEKIEFSEIERTIILKSNFGTTITKPIEMQFYCENSSVTPTPPKAFTENGRITVIEPLNCVKLYARPLSEEYKQDPFLITLVTQTINLQPYEAPTVPFTVKLRQGGLPVSGSSFRVTLDGKNTYTKTLTSSDITLDVIPGNYFLSVSDTESDFGTISKNITVGQNGGSEIIEVSKTVKAIISVSVLDLLNSSPIEEAIVNLRRDGKEIDSRKTDVDGSVTFAVTDISDYIIIAKKPGDLNGGYFAKEIELTNVKENISVELKLERITIANAGKTKIIVVDQDNVPVSNARVVLKYEKDDTLVELNSTKNYAFTNEAGEAEVLAGNVKEKVYAYAAKIPFEGESEVKTMSVENLNEFQVIMQIGSTPIKINVVDQTGEKITGEAQIYDIKNNEISGLISIQNGVATTSIKSGTTAYIKITADGYVSFYTAPLFLWPNKTENFNIVLKKEVSEPGIFTDGQIYNKSGQAVRTMKAGEKYYALLTIEADKQYTNTLMHFRTGKENLMENDVIYIENVEAVNIHRQIMGKSYTQDYDVDSSNLTSSLAKWTNVEWENFSGIMQVKVHFKIKENTAPNKEIQFFYRAEFDGERRPASEAEVDLYADTYQSNVYFVGEEAICDGDFCIMSEWLFDKKEELYVFAPYQVKQVNEYKYNFQIVNNSSVDYGSGAGKKPIYLNLELVTEDGKGIKIKEYTIKESKTQNSGENLKALGLELQNFEKNTVVNIELTIQGVAQGNSIIKTQLRADGLVIFETQRDFSVPSEKKLSVSLNRTFIPALLNTQILVEVKDDKGEVLPDADVIIYGKEVGYDEIIIDSGKTNRFGKVTLNSGAHFTTTKLIIDVSKNGFARERLLLLIREEIVSFNPSTLGIELDVIKNNDITKSVEVGNLIGKKLKLFEIKYAADFKGIINEGALAAYLNGLIGTDFDKESVSEIDIVRVRLANGITMDTFIEPLNTNGELILTFQVEGTNIIYDEILPFNLSVVSEAQMESDSCLIANITSQTKTTEMGRVQYIFEIVNACTADGFPITLDDITVSSSGEIPGMAELSLQSTTSSKGGRTAIDGRERKIIDSLATGEKLVGTLFYTPSTEAAGQTVVINISLAGSFMGNKTKATKLDFTTNVLNLKECMSISGDSGTIGHDEEATITVDATACLGQKIDVYLCYLDSGCSGGAEGTISLSKRTFTLQNTSETITAYGPSIPGSYGITVWARVSGQGAHSYIGEIPIAFRESETKWFELNKYEVNIMGSGTQDIILLTNKMLTQDVVVEADNCTWGVAEPDKDWMQIIAGAAVGATLGNMIGKSFTSQAKPETKNPTSQGATQGDDDDPAAGSNGATPTDTEVRSLFNELITSEFNQTESDTVYLGRNPSTGIVEPVDPSNISTYSIATGGTYANAGTITRNTNSDGTLSYSYVGPGRNITSSNLETITNHAYTYTQPSLRSRFWSFFNPARAPSATYNSQTGVYTKSNSSEIIPLEKISFASEVISFPASEVAQKSTANAVDKISFGRFGTLTGWTTVLGAVAGALAAYYLQDYDCSDETQTASYTDYGIFLTGETINVLSADNEETNSRTIPSDAGPLNFTLGGVSPSWDFSDATYSSVEEVGIKFTNTGLNQPLAKYGTLTINATTNNHGRNLTLEDETRNLDEKDVYCNNANFGEYWIGDTNDDGNCSPVTKGTYSQKYRIRVISAEPKGEEAYLQKSSSCYNGVLTGSTGPQAVPKVLLNWDWSGVNKDTCAYGNQNYVYCDATQFSISLVKRIAELDEFFAVNQTFSCPPDPVINETLTNITELNSQVEVVSEGTIGVKQIVVSVADDQAIATITVENKTGAPVETSLSYSWKGEGEAQSDQFTGTFPTGTSTLTIDAEVAKYSGVYFFLAVFNGPSGNRRVLTYAFRNAPLDSDCWADNSTRSLGGIPSIMYYLADQDFLTVSEISTGSDLYNKINFGAYLMRDAYSDEFFRDFADYYLESVFQEITPNEKKVLEYIKDGKLNVVKRFSNQEQVEAGLYDVWLNIDFGENDFRITDNDDSRVEASLLLIKNPTEKFPFYNIPFNGMIGSKGRQGYGAVYDNENEEISINNQSSLLSKPTTFQNTIGNGIVNVTTSIQKSFERLNSSVGSRGQLASVSYNGSTANITLSPNYATPVIAKYTAVTGDNTMKFSVERMGIPVITGGNILFWTGAAKSKNFYGGNAISTYKESPDFVLDNGEEYGFKWTGVTHPTTMYLKTIVYSPTNDVYNLVAKNNATSFSTPNSNFSQKADLVGISGMNYNSELGGSSLKSLNDLFTLVKNGDVCVTNDGSITSFWWNPRVISTTRGRINSLENMEVALIGN